MDITLIQSPEGNITGVVYFTYTPSLDVAYIFLGLFAVIAVAHLICMFWLQSWYFISFILGLVGMCQLTASEELDYWSALLIASFPELWANNYRGNIWILW